MRQLKVGCCSPCLHGSQASTSGLGEASRAVCIRPSTFSVLASTAPIAIAEHGEYQSSRAVSPHSGLQHALFLCGLSALSPCFGSNSFSRRGLFLPCRCWCQCYLIHKRHHLVLFIPRLFLYAVNLAILEYSRVAVSESSISSLPPTLP